MNAFEIMGGIVLVLACIVIILVVMMQESKAKGMNALSGGGGDEGYSRGRAKPKDVLLNKVTKICAVMFFGISLAVCVISVYVK